ncbi:MAG: aryl-sulfate sulfotransferase [Ignavibacteriae bacterium]|nr:aryl-sulfate sulfotransferase [Ignavibacteriota bacterium]
MRTVFQLIIYFSIIFNLNLFAVDPFSLYVTTLNNPSPGYLALDSYLPGNLNLIDNSGQTVTIKNYNNFFTYTNVQLQSNGFLTFFSNQKFYVLDTGKIIIDSFQCKGKYVTDYHEFILLPNGHAIMLGLDTRVIDMSAVVEGGKKDATVVGNVIQELDENKNVVFEWNSFDHIKLTDQINENDLKSTGFDLTHSNSIAIDLDSNLLLSSRFLDEITKINRKTGEIIWRLGGSKCKNNQFRFVNDTIWGFFGFSHQHSVSRLPNGNLLLFDNGNSRPFPFSRAVEYELNEVEKTAKRVWQYRSFPDTYSSAMGNVQRLPNGNTLIGWGTNNRWLTMTELHPDNSKAMEIFNFVSYRVKRLVYKMQSQTLLVKNSGIYDFNDNNSKTGISIDVLSTNDTGYVSVERHSYKPHNITLFNFADKEIYPNRWVINNYNITDFYGIIKFDLSEIGKLNPAETVIYARQAEGSGTFFPLETLYDSVSNSLQSEIRGFGEFILCMTPKVGTPMLTHPENNAKNMETSTTFNWNPVINANMYRLQLSEDASFSKLANDTSIIESFNIICSNLDYDTKYFWRVKAFIDTLESQWSEVRTFTTIPRQELEAPVLILPASGSVEVPVTGNLKWNTVDGAKYFNIEVALDPDFQQITLKRIHLKTPNLYYNNLENNTVYYWHVSSQNEIAFSPWSDIWNFTTEAISSVENSEQNHHIIIENIYADILSFRFSLEKSEQISLSIYDYFGSNVAFSESKNYDSGEHSIFINSRQFLNGIYFYTFITDGKFNQGKFIIIR